MERTIDEIIGFAEKMEERHIPKMREVLKTFRTEMVREAVNALSVTELAAVQAIFSDRKMEKTYSAKEVATQNGITRSILVTAMDKLQTARVITQRSKGCKGCWVKVLNSELFEYLDKV